MGELMATLTALQREIFELLVATTASYASPMSSEVLGEKLHVAPSYVREQAAVLCKCGLVNVRRGRGGGYFVERAKSRLELQEIGG